MKCENCDYARQASNSEVVACGYFYTCLNNGATFQSILQELNLDTMRTGWGYMQQRFNMPAINPTATQCLSTNGVPVFDKTFCCKHYKEF